MTIRKSAVNRYFINIFICYGKFLHRMHKAVLIQVA